VTALKPNIRCSEMAKLISTASQISCRAARMRDEGNAYACRLLAAGDAVEHTATRA
jgi:hypothetical protein